MPDFNEEWLDEDAGRLVPLYALTGGRTRPSYNQLDLATLVMVSRTDIDPTSFEPEHAQILIMCRRWLSVAEIASHLKVPLAVAKIQLSDLIERGAVAMSAPTKSSNAPVRRETLQQILDGLRAM